jgi:transposase InsO family protein
VNHTLHADLLHFPACTPDGKRYLLVVVDEYTRYCFVALLALKSEAASHLLRIMKRAYVLHTVRVKNLRTDFGGEFKNTVMRIAKEKLGIADEHVPANCHESNGSVERLNLTLASTVRAVLTKAHLPITLWGEAALYAVHIYNLTPHSALLARNMSSAVPHKLYVQDSDERMERLYRQLVPFGVCCNIVQTGPKPQEVKKLDPRSVPGIIVGMGTSTKHYRVMIL